MLLLSALVLSTIIAQAASYYGCVAGRHFWADVDDATGKITKLMVFGPCLQPWVARAYLMPGPSIPSSGSSDNTTESLLNNSSPQSFYVPSPNNPDDVAIQDYIDTNLSTMPHAYINTDNVNEPMVAEIFSHY